MAVLVLVFVNHQLCYEDTNIFIIDHLHPDENFSTHPILFMING